MNHFLPKHLKSMLACTATLCLLCLAFCLQAQTNTWQGDDASDPTNWAVGANWSLGHVPTASEDVIIPELNPAFPRYYPVIKGGYDAVAKSVYVDFETRLTIEGDCSLSIDGATDYGLTILLSSWVTNYGIINIDNTSGPGLIFDGGGGRLDNIACGIINLNGTLNIDSGGDVFNSGLMVVNTVGEHTVDIGSFFFNNGILSYLQVNPIPNVTNNEIIIEPASGCEIISPAFQLGNPVDFTILGVFTDDLGNNPAGTYDVITNTFTADPILTEGVHNLFVKIEDTGGGCTRFAPWQVTSPAQTYTGNVELTTQAEVDAWPACFTVIDGYLIISGPDITDLSPLDNLIEVTGNLGIEGNPALVELSGFPALQTVGNFMWIEGNNALTDVSGFTALSTVEQLTIYDNGLLADVTGFAGLTTVGYIGIENNSNLLDITGFSTGNFTVEAMSISANESLADISGLSGLNSVMHYFYIRDNPSLNDVTGFAALTTMEDEFLIQTNAALLDVSGFAALESVDGNFEITYNESLTDVSGFAALQTVGENFEIRTNPYLTDVSGFAALETVGDRFEISDNNYEEFDDFGPSPTGEKGSTGSNKLLVGVSGFGVLETVDGDFSINNNSQITSINGFSALSSVGGNFEINQNAALTEVSGFSALASVEATFEISDNPMLTELSGFTALTAAEEIAIEYNESLTNIGAFTALTTLDGNIQIGDNALLANVDGLSALTSVGGYLLVYNNGSLANVDGLSALTSVGGYLAVQSNGSLTDCCGIYELISTPGAVEGPIYISNNDTGCDNEAEIIILCSCDAPEAICQAFTAVLVGSSVTISTADVDAGSTADCGQTGLTISQSQFDCSHVGTPQTVTLTITDINNESDDCEAIVTVVDNTPPTATCPTSIPDVVLGTNGSGTLLANIGDGSSTDNCTANLTETSPTASFDCTQLGIHTVTLTASDGTNSHTATCSFNVVDNQAPVAICPTSIADVVLDTDGNGSLPANIGDGSSSDNCTANLTETSPTASFDCSQLGGHTVTLTASDGTNENTVTCSFNVVDNQTPVAICPTTIPDVVLDANGNGTLPANIGGSLSTDNCTANLTETSPALNFNCAGAGPQAVTLTASDGTNSATASCPFTVLPFITNISTAHTDETCAGAGDGTITVSATTPGGQVKYSIDGGVNFQSVGTFNNVPPGTYNVVIKVFGIPNVCEKTHTETVAPGVPSTTWYKDIDNDNWSDGIGQVSCARPTGYKTPVELGGNTTGDCNDNDPSAYPGQTWYKDTDNDNYTDGTTQTACARPVGHKTASELVNTTDTDCNDNNAAVNHGATEICNGIDDDCDGEVDEGISGGLTWTGNVAFTTQAQVNAWSACYSIINGNVTIVGAGVNNLGPLGNIVEITGGLTMQSTAVTSMAGLDSLTTLGGTLFIYFNSSLNTLNGLNALATVGGSFMIYYNFQLGDCCAVHGLINGGVTGAIAIFYNKAGCNSVADINANCSGTPLVGGNGGNTFATANSQPISGKEMALYPNPANAEVTVRFGLTGTAATLKVTDLLGRVVFERALEEGTDRITIGLRDGAFENGLYLVSLYEDGKMRVKQLVIQK